MFTKIIILCMASASFLYSVMYAVVSAYYYKNGSHTSGTSQEGL